MKKICVCCLNAYSDPLKELTTKNDLSYVGVGDTENGYTMQIRTGADRPTVLYVSHWDEKIRQNQTVGIYEMKYCPECGRKITENDKIKAKFQT